MFPFGLQKSLRCCIVANLHLLGSVMAFLALTQSAWAQGKNDWILVPRDAPNIAAALAALPGTGTVVVAREAKTDPGFVAMGFKNLTISVDPSVRITGSAMFTKCTTVWFSCSAIDMDLHIDKSNDVRVMSPMYGYMLVPPPMLEIKQAAYVKDSTNVSLVGLSFRKGAFGIRVDTCMDKPAVTLDKWRRGKASNALVAPVVPGVRVGACNFADLEPIPGTTFPVGIHGTASYVEVWNSKFGPFKGYGVELEMGSLAGIRQCSFQGLNGDAIYLSDAEGFVENSTITGVAAGLGAGNGIHAVLLPSVKEGQPRFLNVSGVKISQCEGNGVWADGGAGEIRPQISDCEIGITASNGFSGPLVGSIDNCNFGIIAIGGFTGRIDGVIRGVKKTGVIVADTKGPVMIGQPGAISSGNYNIYNSGETALFISNSQNVTASPEISNRFEGPPGGGIVVKSSDVKFPRARVQHAARPAGFYAENSTITGTISVSDGQGPGFFLSGTTLKGDYNTSHNLGAGFEITNRSEVTLAGQDIAGDAGGGFIVNGGSTLTLTDCNVYGSTVPVNWNGPINGAAPPDLFKYGIKASDDATVTARNCRIGSWSRAGVFVSDARAELNDCILSLNRTYPSGNPFGAKKAYQNIYNGDFDGAYVRGNSKLVFTNGSFQVLGGNGFRVGQGGKLEVRDLKTKNAPPKSGTADHGHWLLVEADGDALIENNDIAAWYADGIRVRKSGKARIVGNYIESGLYGHGVRVDDGSETTLRNNLFTWAEHKDAFRGNHVAIFAETGARIEESNNRAGAKNEPVSPRR